MPILPAILSTVVKTATLVEIGVVEGIQTTLAHASGVCRNAAQRPRVAQAVIVASVVSENVGKGQLQLQYHNHVWNRCMV